MDSTLVQKEDKVKKIPKPNNLFDINCSSKLEFFKWWCVFLRPFVHLTDREIDVVSVFLKQRQELSKSISDPVLLDAMIMSDDVRDKVIAECGVTLQHFYVILSSLKKKGIINNNILHPKLIPSVREDDNGVFRLLIQFKETTKR